MTAPTSTIADALAFAQRVVRELLPIHPRPCANVEAYVWSDESGLRPVQFCASFYGFDRLAKAEAILRLLLPESAIPLRNYTPQSSDAHVHGMTASGIPWLVIVPRETFYVVCPPSPEEADARDADKAQQAEQELAARRAEAKSYSQSKARE